MKCLLGFNKATYMAEEDVEAVLHLLDRRRLNHTAIAHVPQATSLRRKSLTMPSGLLGRELYVEHEGGGSHRAQHARDEHRGEKLTLKNVPVLR